MSMHRTATVEIKQNLELTARSRGKIVSRREGHNIWLALGAEFLAQLISYSSLTPLTPYRNDRIRYMGVGIGGTRQLAIPTVNSSPYLLTYPGTNAQTDTDDTVLRLERPVRISGSQTTPPYSVSDVWLNQVQAPPDFPTARSVLFSTLLTEADVSYGAFGTVPLSEVALFSSAALPTLYNNTALAYDTFETLTKTPDIAIEIKWTIRFGS